MVHHGILGGMQVQSGNRLYYFQIRLRHLLAPFSFCRPLIPLSVALLRCVLFALGRRKNSQRILAHSYLEIVLHGFAMRERAKKEICVLMKTVSKIFPPVFTLPSNQVNRKDEKNPWKPLDKVA